VIRSFSYQQFFGKTPVPQKIWFLYFFILNRGSYTFVFLILFYFICCYLGLDVRIKSCEEDLDRIQNEETNHNNSLVSYFHISWQYWQSVTFQVLWEGGTFPFC
jgi:hypothetical protein